MWGRVAGYIGVIEVTHSAGGYHPHLHLYVTFTAPHCLRRIQWDWAALHREWDLAAGYPAQLDCQPAPRGRSGAAEMRIAQYLAAYLSGGVAKKKGRVFGGLSREDAYDWRHTLRGLRLVRSRDCPPPPGPAPQYWRCCVVEWEGDCTGSRDQWILWQMEQDEGIEDEGPGPPLD